MRCCGSTGRSMWTLATTAVTHAIIVTAIRGDGTAGETQITYIDPADGRTITSVFADFLNKYEAPSAVNTWPYVIVHWRAGASVQQSFTRSHAYSFHSPSWLRRRHAIRLRNILRPS